MQLFVKDLTVMDFSYLCPVRGMVGESWIVDVILDGELNEESMVLDFSKVKKRLKSLIDEYVDHKLLIPVENSLTHIKRDQLQDKVQVDFLRGQGKSIHINCPADAYAFVYAETVSMESVSQYLKDIIATHLPENVGGIELGLRTEVIESPYYHYTHGLKKHDGNCQRIAHGHRSRVDVLVDGEANEYWQQYWAKRWCDIYIGTREDLVELSTLELAPLSQTIEMVSQASHYCFAYESSQGEFELIMPKAECDLIDTDSTVECLAQFMAEQQKQLSPEHQYKVFAYEGVGKGAIANA